jgi:hypothetical protein
MKMFEQEEWWFNVVWVCDVNGMHFNCHDDLLSFKQFLTISWTYVNIMELWTCFKYYNEYIWTKIAIKVNTYQH